MNLRNQIETDLSFILEDGVMGFGWPITLINPQGAELNLTGYSGDISQAIDPDTGQMISGRYCYATLRLSSIYEGSFTIPQGISDSSSLPWLCRFNDINGTSYTFKVFQSNPDRSLGVVNLTLEGWA